MTNIAYPRAPFNYAAGAADSRGQQPASFTFGSGTAYASAGTVGISTGAVSPGALSFDRSGKLTLDTAELTAALEADPDGVYELFASSEAKGIAVRLTQGNRYGGAIPPAMSFPS